MLDISIKDVRIYREACQEGHQEGRQEGFQETAISLVSRLLKKRFPEISDETQTTVSALPTTMLEALGEALLDFEHVEDLQAWLTAKA